MQPDQNQYGFFMDQQQTPKKGGLPFPSPNMSRTKLILFGVGGMLLLLVVITVVVSMLGGGPTNADQLLGVAQKQNELIRVSKLALKEAKGTEARNIASTTHYALLSDQATLVSSLKAQGMKVGSKELKAGQDSDTDKELTTATQNNRFDEAYLEYIEEGLADYQKSLNTVYKTSESKKLKTTLRQQYEHASVLIGVAPE